jgi:hypothetical protein
MDSYAYEQAKKKATFQAKKYLIENGYTDVLISCTRGTFHLTNGDKYFLSAAHILEKATGLNFTPLNAYMARLDKAQF